jgi:uncharacterized membrane protein YccF (DUF307 family)
MIHFPSWPGFVPAIHVFLAWMQLDVDARHKAGHDELCNRAPFHWLLFESDSEENLASLVCRQDLVQHGLNQTLAGIRFDCAAYRHRIGKTIPRERASLSFQRNRMPPVSILLNILWLLLGGVWMAAAWVVAAVIMAITIIGLPWARAAFNIAAYTLLPFGQKAVRRDSLTGYSDIGTGPLGLIGNLIWLVLAGWWLALGHIVTAVVLAVTIIGIPFAWAHLKLAGIALWPIGKVIVPI